MTSYEQGFLAKCAEHGIPSEAAGQMLKSALSMYVPNADGFQNADSNGVITLDGAIQQVIGKGDTVSGIMKRHGIPQKYLAAVLKHNGLTLDSAKRIRPGQVLSLYSDPEMYAPPAK